MDWRRGEGGRTMVGMKKNTEKNKIFVGQEQWKEGYNFFLLRKLQDIDTFVLSTFCQDGFLYKTKAKQLTIIFKIDKAYSHVGDNGVLPH